MSVGIGVGTRVRLFARVSEDAQVHFRVCTLCMRTSACAWCGKLRYVYFCGFPVFCTLCHNFPGISPNNIRQKGRPSFQGVRVGNLVIQSLWTNFVKVLALNGAWEEQGNDPTAPLRFTFSSRDGSGVFERAGRPMLSTWLNLQELLGSQACSGLLTVSADAQRWEACEVCAGRS